MILKYLRLFFRKLETTWSKIALIGSIPGFFFAQKILPDSISSLELGIIMFMSFLLFCEWRIWADTERELEALRDKLPKFTIKTEEVTQYSIEPIIQNTEKEVGKLADEIEEDARQRAKAVEQKTSNNATTANSLGLGILSAHKQSLKYIRSLTAANSLPKAETKEEKYERLAKHLASLKKYEERLQSLYKIKLSIESSIHAENVEASITHNDELILEDDYVERHIPQTNTPDLVNFSPHTPIADHSSLSRSDKQDKTANSGRIAYLQSETPDSLFDKEFYATIKNDTALNARVVAKGTRPKNIQIPIDTSIATLVTFKE